MGTVVITAGWVLLLLQQVGSVVIAAHLGPVVIAVGWSCCYCSRLDHVVIAAHWVLLSLQQVWPFGVATGCSLFQCNTIEPAVIAAG